jgi:hypothetical protein
MGMTFWMPVVLEAGALATAEAARSMVPTVAPEAARRRLRDKTVWSWDMKLLLGHAGSLARR